MGVGTPGFEFQLTANRLGAGIISGIRRGAACPARRSGARRRGRVVSAKSSDPGLGGRRLEDPREDLRLLFWPLEASPEE